MRLSLFHPVLAVRVILSVFMAFTLMAVPLTPANGPGVVFAANDIVLTETGGSTRVDEAPGSTDEILVRLSDQPASTVTLSVTSSDQTEVTVTPATLTFTTTNWNQNQVVTVAGVEDTEADGTQTPTVAFQVVTSGSDYAGKSASLQVTALDNEAQGPGGFTIVEQGGQTRVNESGTTDMFTIRLNRQPNGTVVFNVTSSDPGEVAVTQGQQVTFTSANWNTPQQVTVAGVDDNEQDGNQSTGVIVSVNSAATTDDSYDSVPNQTVNVITEDNETPSPGSFVVETGDGTTTTEEGGQDSFTVRLTQQPQGTVVVNVTSSRTGEMTVAPDRLTFTAANWDTPQTVTVTGVDDSEPDGPQSVSIVLSVNDTLSSDDYDAVPDRTVTATNQDNEPAAAGLNVSRGSITVSESGSSETFTVRLNKQPASNVVVALTSSDTGEATVSPSQMTFTSETWDDPQTATVTGVDDAEDDGDQTSTITVAVVDDLSDNEYDGVTNRTVTVTTTDNDPGVRPAPVPLTPTCGSKVNTLGPTLTWTQEPGARWFHLQVIPFNNDGPGINLIISDDAIVAAAQYDIKEPDFGSADPNYVMLPDLTYTWRVRTALGADQPGDDDWGPWSQDCTFETANKSASTIALLSPTGGTTVGTLRPVLRWADSDDEVFYYEVQVSRDANFCNSAGCPMLYWELRHGGVTDPPRSYTPPSGAPLEPGTTYHWRVRPRIQGDGTPVAWSPASSFRTP